MSVINDAIQRELYKLVSAHTGANQTNWFVHNIPHPLYEIYYRVINGEADRSVLRRINEKIPAEIQNVVHEKVFTLSQEPNKGWEFGKNHMFDDLHILQKAIDEYAQMKFASLSSDQKNAVYGNVYRIAGSPKTNDPEWGKKEVLKDTGRLIFALHLSGHLSYGKSVSIADEFEANLLHHSDRFQLERKEPEKGRIFYVNGTGCSLAQAKSDAARISDQCAQGYNMHGIFCATNGDLLDVVGVVLGESGIATTPTKLLLEDLQSFFIENPCSDDKCLIVLHSAGATVVWNALNRLPEEMRKRVIVLAIAPAHVIESSLCHKAINYILPSDATIHPINSDENVRKSTDVVLLPPHEDKCDAHDPHGSSYTKMLKPVLDQYIKKNDVF